MSELQINGSTPIAYRIDDLVRVSGIGRTKIYEALKAGQLRAHKSGKRTLIPAESARDFIARLPVYAPQSAIVGSVAPSSKTEVS
jgi:excisionase family DNA binding protein